MYKFVWYINTWYRYFVCRSLNYRFVWTKQWYSGCEQLLIFTVIVHALCTNTAAERVMCVKKRIFWKKDIWIEATFLTIINVRQFFLYIVCVKVVNIDEPPLYIYIKNLPRIQLTRTVNISCIICRHRECCNSVCTPIDSVFRLNIYARHLTGITAEYNKLNVR